MATHFHYYEDEAMVCRRWFCQLENRVEDIMQTFSVIDRWRKNHSDIEVSSMERVDDDEEVYDEYSKPLVDWHTDGEELPVEEPKALEPVEEQLAHGAIFVKSDRIVESVESRYEIAVLSESSKEDHRLALYELAVLRWTLNAGADRLDQELEDLESLPKIFSYLKTDGSTVYFFYEKSETLPIDWYPREQEPAPLSSVPDNDVKIPVVKLPPVAARKLIEG